MILSGDLKQEIAALRARVDGDIVLHGGVSFVRSMLKHGLVDEYRLIIHPVILGRGSPIYSDSPITELKLLDIESFPSGAAAHIYRKIEEKS